MKLLNNKLLKRQLLYTIALCLVFNMLGCKKFIQVDAPVTSTNAGVIYGSDANAASVLTGIYAKMSNSSFTTPGGIITLSLFPALSADELTIFNYSSQSSSLIISNFIPFYQNSLTSLNTGGNYWNTIYPIVYTANAAIEGLNSSVGLSVSVKNQLLGESKFIRAFCYFYLVNLYGDVPLAISTDYQINSLLPRARASQVYQQIISDLKDAQNLLIDGYLGGDVKTSTTERTRPNKWAATALLARTYLYTNKYDSAETQATAIINNATLYDTVSLNLGVFNKNTREAIWQLQPVQTSITNTQDARLFVLPVSGPNTTGTYPVYLNTGLVNSFETGDNRKNNWTNSVTSGPVYYYANKYKIAATGAAVSEYLMILRLGEQYLIRSEARAQQGNLSAAATDLNLIRKRAGLPNTLATTQPALLSAILHERQVELFTEWGHRWFDLKRTNTLDAVMSTASTQKGTTWNPNWALYPIPQLEINANPSLVGHQNPGY